MLVRISRLPVRFLAFKDGLYVTEAAPFDVLTNRGRVNYARAIGARVVRIGETDIDAAWQAIASFISSDNPEGVRADIPRHTHRPEILHTLGLILHLKHVPIRLQDPNGNLFDMDFISLPGSPPPNFTTSAYPSRTPTQLYRTRPTSEFYWYDYLSEAKTVYFQYNQCIEMPGLPFATFLNGLLNFIDTHEVVKIAIDLRRNSGGNSAILIPFINAIRARQHLNQQGRLFVLIDNGTKSSAIHNAIHFRQLQTNPILVGEPTGGTPNGYGEIRSFTLPNSGLNVIYSTRLFQMVPGDPPALHPDILIEFSSADYFAGRDPVLEAVLAY
jgi:hypothetical protein